MDYVYNAPALHRLGRQIQTHELLQKASALEVITPVDLDKLSTEERKKIVREVSLLLRDANFKRQVLHAYGFRCAVTGIQLRLVDAAHILPVAAPGSVDHVSNGIALSPTYHRAFDRGLIHLTEDYEMIIDESKVSILRSLNLVGGLPEFGRFINRTIQLPPDPNQRPNKTFIKEANRLRLKA
jgi:putative restriction endonuclease